ncbi:hypothetical protein LSAT2_009616 [Lamellibrachia satsuma]|nr:hypothetical protein LSAT2_009616 [Lamellibrachia satsuma]
MNIFLVPSYIDSYSKSIRFWGRTCDSFRICVTQSVGHISNMSLVCNPSDYQDLAIPMSICKTNLKVLRCCGCRGDIINSIWSNI